MNLADPAPEVEAATAEPAKSESIRREEYVVRDAENRNEAAAEKASPVEPAEVILHDPRTLTKGNPPPPTQSGQHHRDDLSLNTLRSKSPLLLFEGPAAITRGMQATSYRKFQIFLSKCIPYGKYLYDEKDFVSYGELVRYIAVKDGTLLVYTEETATHPLYSVPIDTLHAVKEDSKKPHPKSVIVSPMTNTNMQSTDLQTVLLVNDRNELILQCTFDCKFDVTIVDRFIRAVVQHHTNQETANHSRFRNNQGGKGKKG